MKNKKQLISLVQKDNKNTIKLYSLLLFFCFLTFTSANAQTGKVSINLKNASVKELFNAIESQTPYRFSYRSVEVENKKGVTISVKNAKLKDLLIQELPKHHLSHIVQGNKIIVTPATDNQSSDKSNKVTGKVVDTNGEPIVGATIKEQGTTNGTITDMDGNFLLEVPNNAILEITYIGYRPQEIAIKGQTRVDIKLAEDTQKLDEVVVVGYGTQKKATLTGAVASLKGEELAKVSQPNMKANLIGKIPGVRYQESTGEPGVDSSDRFNIRGFGEPLVIVDGVERPFTQIDPNEIASMNVLKDASAAVYGFKGVNGVIIIETKKGEMSRPKINYSYSIGLQSPVKNLEMMNAYEYAYYRNQALMNAGQSKRFTDEEVEKYRTGSDPINYPSTDWYAETVRKVAPKQQHNLNINGGSEKIRYFFSLGYLDQESILKSTQEFKRYNFRSNITAEITSKLNAEVGLGGHIDDYKYPYWTGDEGIELFTAIKSNAPNVPVYANNNKNYYYNSDNNELNPVAMLDRDATGFKDKRNVEFNGQLALNYEIFKGLKARAFFAYDYTNLAQKEMKTACTFYTYDSVQDTYNPITKVAKGELMEKTQPYYKTTQQYSLNYKNTFNDLHDVEALALWEWKETNTNWFMARRYYSTTSAIPELDRGDVDNMYNEGNSAVYKYGGLVGRLNYVYAGKYMAEFSFRYDGSYKTAPDKRWGFFPAVSAGWRISEEQFMKDLVPQMDNLKLRASWGSIGNDSQLNASQFVSGWQFEDRFILGGAGNSSASITNGMKEANLANPNITWYKVMTTNVGLDGSFWGGKLSFEFDYFYRKTTGYPATRNTSLPTTSGIPLPQENLNSSDNRGFELSLGTVQRIGNVNLQIKGNVAYAREKDLYKEQALPLNQYKNWRDNGAYRWKNVTWGYEHIGQFQSYDEIYNSPIQDGKGNSSLRPGDIKYKDLNGDGLIDANDEKVIGKGTFPDLNFGLTLAADWKGFDVNILFQGASNYTQVLNALTSPFRGPGEGNGFRVWMDSWHKADYNDPDSEWVPGKFPSLRIEGNDNNSKKSTYWTTDAYYVRLKSIEIGYTIPKNLLSKVGIEHLRVYANAYNPLTITNVKYTDPEAIEGWQSFYYPQLKVYSFGVNVSF